MSPALGHFVPAEAGLWLAASGQAAPELPRRPSSGDFVPLQSNHIGNVTVQRPADTQQRFHADMLPLAHVGDHIGGKTGGQPQILFPHAALFQGVP